ncbi:MAG: response regulator [Sphingomonas sp.]|uniref:response regulator n=1 Tax=Sphingomonas sp. TaxID=28214 RepID=UPI001AD4315B|nr:response regulator [Sphingomonas sp.]MBN8808250.1 response regulator [Sphingomonas sp.]
MAGNLAGKRILVVEDEYFIASDLKAALTRADAIVVGPAGNLDRALALAEGEVDAALLDVNLEGSFSYAIADRLAARDVPYLFLTGYDSWALPDAYRDAPRAAKPFSTPAVLDMVERLIVTEKTP